MERKQEAVVCEIGSISFTLYIHFVFENPAIESGLMSGWNPDIRLIRFLSGTQMTVYIFVIIL